jgi:hypothetical protein
VDREFLVNGIRIEKRHEGDDQGLIATHDTDRVRS